MTIPDLDQPCGEHFTYRDLIACGETWHRLTAEQGGEKHVASRATHVASQATLFQRDLRDCAAHELGTVVAIEAHVRDAVAARLPEEIFSAVALRGTRPTRAAPRSRGMNMKKALMLIGVATMGLVAANAWAVDNRTLPGMLCQKIDGNGILSVGWSGAISNMSTTDILRVSCPIIRDNLNSPPISLAVNVVDANANPDNPNNPAATGACCQFYSTDYLSENVNWGNNRACSSGSQTPNTMPLWPQVAWSWANGTEMVFCQIPPLVSGQPASQLVTYAVNE